MGLNGLYGSLLCIKGQKNIYPRIITGLDDAHNFLSTSTRNASKLCSWLDKWNIIDVIQFRLRDLIGLFVYIVGILVRVYRRYAPKTIAESQILNDFARVIANLFHDILFVYAY